MVSKAIVLMGAPGTGKGTQSRLLNNFFGFPQISTGDMLREIANEDTARGKNIRDIQAVGGYVSDDILSEIVSLRVSKPDCAHGYILDGFPRTAPQVLVLDRIISQTRSDLYVVEVSVPREILFKRLTGRYTCSFCGEIYNQYFRQPLKEGICDKCGSSDFKRREDDSPGVVENRQQEYEIKTAPIFALFKKMGKIISIDGLTSVEQTFEQLKRELGLLS